MARAFAFCAADRTVQSLAGRPVPIRPDFNAQISQVKVESLPWFVERELRGTSIGDVIVLVLVRLLLKNISGYRDEYIHVMSLSVLANMAPHLTNIHVYAAQVGAHLLTSSLARLLDPLAGIAGARSMVGHG